MRTIFLAAAQMTCQDGQVIENLTRATKMAAEASQNGAQLVLFPEFMPQGYRLTPDLWDAAEPFDGPTTRWLRETAQNYNVFTGTSFLEVINGHFLNTFALASPDGKIAGRVSKRSPSIWEAYFFRGHNGPQYIDTDLGRIGVGICFDNHTYAVANAIAQADIDLMLMPHSYCIPTKTNKAVSQADIDRLDRLPGQVARMYNEWFGVPVILCNKSGAWESPVPRTILGQPKDYHFNGRSMIIDSDGRTKAELENQEAVITAQVTLVPQFKKHTQPARYSRYIYPGPAGREVLCILEAVGSFNYTRNAVRKQKAQRVTA